MNQFPQPLDLRRIQVFPLATRKSLSRIETLLRDPASTPPSLSPELAHHVRECAERIRAAQQQGAAVLLFYGAHLIKNGAHRIVLALLEGGWLTHLATNGAGVIHDWELAHLGRTEESVRENVATGTFGTWEETGRAIHLALWSGALRMEGFGRSVGRFMVEDGVTLPEPAELARALQANPADALAPARAELLQAMTVHGIPAGRHAVAHPWKDTAILAGAFRRNVPMTAHPGIGYDIIINHPWYSGGAVGRAAHLDFALLAASVGRLDGGVVLSVGSAIMAPQVFEKCLSCVNNLRRQAGRPVVRGHSIYVVDIQDGGRWNWDTGEPPKDNPAYYLRFCKSFARMGGTMRYIQCDNVVFLHNLLHQLSLVPSPA